MNAKRCAALLTMTPTLPGRPTLTLDATLAPNIGPSELATLLLTTGRTAASVARVNRTTECRRSSATALSRRNTSGASTPASKERCSHREQGTERTVTGFTHESLLERELIARSQHALPRSFGLQSALKVSEPPRVDVVSN